MLLLDISIKYRIVIGISAMVLLFISFLIAFINNERKKLQHQKDLQSLREQQQNQLIEAAVRSEELERNRIAEELHDEVGAILSSSKLHLQGIKADMNPRDRQLFDKSNELLDEGIKKVRGISHNLHSNILRQFGLNEAIRHFVNQLTNGTLVRTEIHLDNNYPNDMGENDISIYRLIQEVVSNIIKHSNASIIKINSSLNTDKLQFLIWHDGNGITQEDFEKLRYQKEGLGLKNIQNRIILLKGSIRFGSENSGYATIIDVPIQK